MRAAVLVLVSALSCTATIGPVEPEPGAGCEEACANIERLRCDVLPKSMSCVDACEKQNSQRDQYGQSIRALDTECIAGADSCEQLERCE